MRIEHKTLSGFYLVPGSSRVYASRDGDFWDDITKSFVKVRNHDFYNYPFVDAPGDRFDGHLAHRAMAELFVYNDEPGVKDIVNHKNGIVTDYRPENLEWVTRSENSNHAYKNGLRTDNKYVLLKDLETDEVYGFYSLSRAAAHLKINPAYLSLYLSREQTAPFRKKYDLIWKGESWHGFKLEDVGVVRRGQMKPVVGIRESDGKAHVFSSISTASEYTKLSNSVIQTSIKRSLVPRKRKAGTPVGDYGWKFMDLKDFKRSLDDSVRVEKKIPFKGRTNRKPYPVEVTDLKTGEKTIWPSIALVAQSLTMKRYTLGKILTQTGGIFQGKKYRYMSEKYSPAG